MATAVASARGSCAAPALRRAAPAARVVLLSTPPPRAAFPRAPRALRCAPPRRRAATPLLARAEGKGSSSGDESSVASKLRAVAPLVDAAASLVPESVPRPVAKAGVVVIGGGVALWAVKSLLSTAFSLAALLLLAFVAWTITQSSDAAKSAAAADDDDDEEEDPLATARRIMKKYK